MWILGEALYTVFYMLIDPIYQLSLDAITNQMIPIRI
jgi:hypothetical protein